MIFLQNISLLLLFIALSGLIAGVGLRICRRHLNAEMLEQHKEPVSIFFGAVSLVYSLILAFVIIAVWEDYEELNQTIEQEADRVCSILIQAENMPPGQRNAVQALAGNYVHEVLLLRWEENAGQALSRSAIPPLARFLQQAEAGGSRMTLDRMSKDLTDLSALRRTRLSHVHSHVPGLIWTVLVLGSLLIMVFSWLFRMESRRMHLFLTVSLCAMIGMCLYIVYMLDHPLQVGLVDLAPFRAIQGLTP